MESGGLDANLTETWLIHDTISNKMFHIDWKTQVILSHWQPISAQKIIQNIKEMQDVDITLSEIRDILMFLHVNCLIEQTYQQIKSLKKKGRYALVSKIG